MSLIPEFPISPRHTPDESGHTEFRLNPQFVERADEAANVVAEHLAQRLVLHRHLRLGTHGITEFGLDHAEGRFGVAPLVVMGVELFLIEREEVERLLEQSTRRPGGR